MRRVRIAPVALVAIAAIAAALMIATSSASVKQPGRQVVGSPGLYGLGLSRLPVAQDYRRMANGGTGTVRFVLDWRRAQPSPTAAFHWGQSDRYVRRAAEQGITVLPVLFATPGWLADSFIKAPVFSAKARRKWQAFVQAAVARYGRGGAFWAQNPQVPYDPARDWQVWNEENSPGFWAPRPSAPSYLRLLSLSADAIRQADPRGQVVLGGMFEAGSSHGAIVSWQFLSRLYRLGGARDFDVVGAHPYSPTLSGYKLQLRRLGRVIRRNHDGGTPIWIDEIGWGSGPPSESPQNKGLRGQASFLRRAFSFAQANRRHLGIQRILWFPWRDSGHTPTACAFCGVTGLIRTGGAAKPSWGSFRRIATR
jgi:hypothetical protein